MKFSIKNFGCRTNLAEAMEWVETLSSYGYKYTQNNDEAEILILNSCVITKNAEREVRRIINNLKRKKSSQFVLLTGCLTDSLKNISDFLIVENAQKKEVPLRIIERFGKQGDPEDTKMRARAHVKIQEGCNFKCSFCIIPFVRGKSRSLREDEILERVRNFLKKGYKEIVISGTHLNSWGLDLIPKKNLLYLLKKLDSLEGLKRIRLTSLDPRFLNNSFLSNLKEISKIAPHFHISLQSCSDEILKRMNRKCSAREYAKILNSLREMFPEACIGADIIVGFPYEDDTEFERTYNFLKNSPVNYLHVFPFSPREGTIAFSMPQISPEIKKKRVNKLRELSREKRREFYSRFFGCKLLGVVIGRSGDKLQVLTHNYIKVILEPNGFEERDEVFVTINPDNVIFNQEF